MIYTECVLMDYSAAQGPVSAHCFLMALSSTGANGLFPQQAPETAGIVPLVWVCLRSRNLWGYFANQTAPALLLISFTCTVEFFSSEPFESIRVSFVALCIAAHILCCPLNYRKEIISLTRFTLGYNSPRMRTFNSWNWPFYKLKML